MKVTIQDAGPCRKTMRVVTTADEVQGDYHEILQTYVKAGKVPGFRKGKAPASVIETHYADGIADAAKETLIPRFYREAMEAEGVKPVAVIDITDVTFTKGDGLAFTALIDVPPEFKLPKYEKISVTRKLVEVTDAEVDEAQTSLLASHARFEDVNEGTVNEGDLVLVDYNGTSDEMPMREVAPDASALDEGRDFWALVGSRELFPGFNAGVIGAAVGEQRTLEVDFPDDFPVEAVRGRKATYTVDIKGRRERKLPELTEAFLEPFGVKTEAELRERVRESLVERAEGAQQDSMREQIGKHLLGKATFDIPESVVQEETRSMVRNVVDRVTMQGATREQIEAQSGQIVEHATAASRERVRLQYILARIAEAEALAVDDAEIDERIASMAAGYRMPPEKLKAELEKRNALERLASDMRAEKAMTRCLETAKIKEKK